MNASRRWRETEGVLGDSLWDRFNGGAVGTRWYYWSSISFDFDLGLLAMQPLSSVRRNAHAQFGADDTMASRPAVAVKIAECISEWANIESMLGVFLGLLLHANGRTTLGIYMSLENRAAQLRMLEAAAEWELDRDAFDIFMVLLEQRLRPTMRTRDKLAHWCWGYSNDLPNDLLLLEPDEKTHLLYTALHGPVDIDRSEVFVITEKFLSAFLDDIRRTQGYLATFMQSFEVPGVAVIADAEALDRLSTEPSIRRGLDRRRASRLRGEPPLLPEEWHVEAP